MFALFGLGVFGAGLFGLGIPELLFLLFLMFGIGGTIFWVLVLVDCLKNESSQGNDKIVWVVVIVLAHWIGALIYLIVRRPKRIQEQGK